MIELEFPSYGKDFSYQIDYEADRSLQLHKGLEILYVLCGCVEIQINNKALILETDDLLIINSYEVHQVSYRDHSHSLSLILGESIQGKKPVAFQCCSKNVASGPSFAKIKNHLANMFRLYVKDCESYREDIFSEMYVLLSFLQSDFGTAKYQSLPPQKNLALIDHVLKYISSHYKERISLKQLSQLFYVSESYLSRTFQRYLKIPFVQYLREIRLSNIYTELCENRGQKNITDLALEYGFCSTTAFITAFKEKYGITPGKIKALWHDTAHTISHLEDGNLFHKLMSYASDYADVVRTDKKKISIQASTLEPGLERGKSTFELINVGWANELLLKEIQEQVHLCQQALNFHYLRCHGIFDDNMHVYSVDDTGHSKYNFFYVDQVYDFLLGERLLPYVEFGYIPSAMCHKSNKRSFWNRCIIAMPDHLDEWCELITQFLKHCKDRYGIECLRKWKFSIIGGLHVYLGQYSFEEYFELYKRSYDVIKSFDSSLLIGGPGMQLELAHQADNSLLQQFIEQFESEHCMPDFLTFEFFNGVYRKDTELFLQRTAYHSQEPLVLSEKATYLKECISQLQKQLANFDVASIPISVVAFNSTMWQRDPSNDTCFKSCYLFKTILENESFLKEFGYWTLSDLMGELFGTEETFHGGYGLFTQNGIPKSGYWAYYLLRQLGNKRVFHEDGITITKFSDEDVQISLYNYCYFDTLTRQHIYVEGSKENRYTGFQKETINEYDIDLQLPHGEYQIDILIISRSRGCGSAYDTWLQMGAPEHMTEFQKQYLGSISAPYYSYERKSFSSGQAHLNYKVNPHEVYVIRLKRLHGVSS